MAYGAVEAVVESITPGVAASGSCVTVCPGMPGALELLSDREQGER